MAGDAGIGLDPPQLCKVYVGRADEHGWGGRGILDTIAKLESLPMIGEVYVLHPSIIAAQGLHSTDWTPRSWLDHGV